ncbi:MAG: FAD-binding protein [Desulfobacterales bacterium]|nr:MAG: FAD-binding protein [Desulfobacterales bacterium]
MNTETNVIACDVLVIGGGLAGAAAAKYLLEQNVDVCQAVKGSYGLIGRRGAGASCCGASESGSPRLAGAPYAADDPDALYQRIIQAGLGMADPELVSALVEDFPKIRRQLRAWDIRFDLDAPYHLGYPFVHAIEPEIRSSGMRVFEQTMIADLLVKDGCCAGAVGVAENGEIYLFKTPAVILATGGNAQLFKHNVHPDCVTGDGYAMGFRAGAALINLEFMQIFFCTVHPSRNLFHAWHKEALRDIRNKHGDLILPAYLPTGISVDQCLEENIRHAPFSTRDPASRYLGIAIVKEIQAGRGSTHGGVFVDVTAAIDRLPEKQRRFLRDRGIDLRTSPVQITMGHQCSNGGLRIDAGSMTSIPGVFAAGETGSGMHGADRLGGNMLSACLVFGLRAAESAVRWAKTNPVDRDIVPTAREKIEAVRMLSFSSGKTAPDELLRVLQTSAWNHALTVRSEKSLTQLLCDIRQLHDACRLELSVSQPSDLIRALELKNLLLVGELAARAALQRKESRGGHFREDYPAWNPDDQARAVILQPAPDGSIQIAEALIDPSWQYDEALLGGGRWG